MENARDDISLDDPKPAGKGADGAPDSASSPAADLDADDRQKLHASFNDRISHVCKLAALVVALVALATIALGQEMPRFVLMGLCLSVALLAIAALQDHQQRKQ